MEKEEKEIKGNITTDNIIKYLIIFMLLLVSFKVVIAMIDGRVDGMSIIVGIGFIFFLIILKWAIKEMNL